MKCVHFGKLTYHKILLRYVWCMSCLAKLTPEFHWITAWGNIRAMDQFLSIKVEDKTHIYAEIQSILAEHLQTPLH